MNTVFNAYKRSPENASDDESPTKRRRNKAMRSCEACNRRKVRCDRLEPCAPCAKMGLDCYYRDKDPVLQPKAITLKDVMGSMEKLQGMMEQVLQKNAAHDRASLESKSAARIDLPSRKSIVALPKSNSTWDILLNPDEVDPIQSDSVSLSTIKLASDAIFG